MVRGLCLRLHRNLQILERVMNYQKTVIAPANDYDPTPYHTALIHASNARGQHRADWSMRPRNGVTLWPWVVAVVLAVGGAWWF